MWKYANGYDFFAYLVSGPTLCVLFQRRQGGLWQRDWFESRKTCILLLMVNFEQSARGKLVSLLSPPPPPPRFRATSTKAFTSKRTKRVRSSSLITLYVEWITILVPFHFLVLSRTDFSHNLGEYLEFVQIRPYSFRWVSFPGNVLKSCFFRNSFPSCEVSTKYSAFTAGETSVSFVPSYDLFDHN